MPPRRRVPSPHLRCTPRSALEASYYPAIDTVLKQLKTCSRRLQAALASHRAELQILERLYYKGKNQHRTTIFWRHVADMRRFGGRLDETHIDDVVETYECSEFRRFVLFVIDVVVLLLLLLVQRCSETSIEDFSKCTP